MNQPPTPVSDSSPQDKTTPWIRRHRKLTIGSIAGILLATTVYIIPALQPQKIILLGTLGGKNSRASAINNSGQVVGDWTLGNDDTHAFLWTKEHGMQDLGTLGGNFSRAHAINDAGQIIGHSTTKNDEYHAFIWSQEHGILDIGTLGGNQSYPTAINKTGRIVGYSTTKNNESHAFLWTREHGMLDIGTLGKYSTATAINNAGQIVGHSSIANDEIQIFIWTEQHGMQALNTNNQNTNYAPRINNLGQVLGYFEFKNAPYAEKDIKNCAFFWTKEDGMQHLATLGRQFSRADCMNDAGQIVGSVWDGPPWWTRTWGWLAEKFDLPSKYHPKPPARWKEEAALWTIPPSKKTSD